MATSRIETFRQMLENEPENTLVRFGLANEYLKAELYEEAIGALYDSSSAPTMRARPSGCWRVLWSRWAGVRRRARRTSAASKRPSYMAILRWLRIIR